MEAVVEESCFGERRRYAREVGRGRNVGFSKKTNPYQVGPERRTDAWMCDSVCWG